MPFRCLTSQPLVQQMFSKLTTPSIPMGLERLTGFPKLLSFFSHSGWRLERRKRNGGSERLRGRFLGGAPGLLFLLLCSPYAQPGECLLREGSHSLYPSQQTQTHCRCIVDDLSLSPSQPVDFVFFLHYYLLVRFVSP